MENFLDDEKPVGNEAKSSVKEEKPKITLEMNNKEGEYIPSESLRFNSPIGSADRAKIGSYYQGENTNKLLSDTQSWYKQLGNMAGHIVTNFVGDTFMGIGGTKQIGADIINEIQGKDAEFTNDMMEFGNSIKEWGKENMKTYRENPNETWNLKDPAWWFDGAESAASTLSFLLPSIGAAKGVGAIAKITRAERLVAKAGMNVEKLKLATKIASSATYARNAENMMESFQVRQDTKNNLLSEWKENPDKFNELKDSDVGKELAAEGREVNQENLSNFIAGKAGWKAYAINSANIMFDAIQIAPIFKGFNPATRSGIFGASSKVKEANRKLFNTAARSATMGEKVFDVLNPTISAIGRQASEGVEEMVNYIGTEEAKSLANHLTNKDNSSFSDRIGKYLTNGDMYESGFWGLFGGVAFEGGSRVAGKLLDLGKGIKANDTTDLRMAEIANRMAIISEGAAKIKKITESDLVPEDKKEIINKVKSELSLSLGLRAAANGNIDLLLQQVKSPEYKQKLVDLGIADPTDVDKAIVNTERDILLAEKLYSTHSNSFSTMNIDDAVKSSLINKSVVNDFFVQKNEQKKTDLANQLKDLKAIDSYIRTYQGTNIESLIQLESLKIAKQGVKDFVGRAKKAEDQLLSKRGQTEIDKIDDEISNIQKQVGEEKLDVNSINPKILATQAQYILLNSQNNAQAAKTAEYKSPDNVKKEQDKIVKEREEFQKELEEHFTKEINASIEDGSATVDQLQGMLKDYVKNKKLTSFIHDAIKRLQRKQEVANSKKQDEQFDTETKVEPTQEPTEDKPIVNENPQDEWGDLPKFETIPVDESRISPSYKMVFDKAFNDRDIDNIRSVTVGNTILETTHPNEVQYLRNKVQADRDAKAAKVEKAQLNKEVKNPEQEFAFNENAQIEQEKERKAGKNVSVHDLLDEESTGKVEEVKENEEIDSLTFLSKSIDNGIRNYVPMFGLNRKKYKSQFFTVHNGNIVVKKEHVATIKALMDHSFTEGSEIEIIWDKENPVTSPTNKNNLMNTAFKLVHKGVTIGYLPTKEKSEAEIKNQKQIVERMLREAGLSGEIDINKAPKEIARRLRKIADLELEFPAMIALRKNLKMDDKSVKIKLARKGNGTLISRGTRAEDLVGLEGTGYTEFYALDSRNFLNTDKLINISNEKDSFGISTKLRPGVIYAKQELANGNPIPVPLSVSKVNKVQAKELQGDISKLLTLLNEGRKIQDEEVKAVKERIERYIRVDNENSQEIGFRIFPKGVNKEGQVTEAKIEMKYFSAKRNQMLKAVMRMSTKGDGSYVGIFDEEGEKINPFNNSDKDLTIEHPYFLEILQRKYQNVDFRLLGKNKEFKYDGKTYETYKDYLIKEEVLKTNVAQVVDEDGNFITNLFGQDNDFNLITESVLVGQEAPVEFVNASKEYENELRIEAIKSEDQSYRANYKVFSNSITDPATLLDDILRNPLNDNIKEIGTFFKSNIHKASFTIQRVDKIKGGGYAAFEISKAHPKGILLINQKSNLSEAFFQQTVLHEIAHGLTSATLHGWLTAESVSSVRNDGIIDLNEIKFIDGVPNYVVKFVQDIIVQRNLAIKSLTKKYGKPFNELIKNVGNFYGLESVPEFIAEVLTNPNFRNHIRSTNEGRNFVQRFWNKIIDFLKKTFGSKLTATEDDRLKKAVNTIKDVITNTDEIPELNFDIINQSRFIDSLDGKFSRQEVSEITNTLRGIILNTIKNKRLDITNGIENNNSIYESVRNAIAKFHEQEAPESLKPKAKEILNYFDTFYSQTVKNINRNFKITAEEDLYEENDQIDDTGNVEKDWDDKKEFTKSSQESTPNQIKMFVMSTPELNSTKIDIDANNNPIYDRKVSGYTGLGTFVDFNVVYPYLVRNIIGARSGQEIIDRLYNMSTVHSSFAYMAHQLKQDANLLAQFETNLARKYIYDSYVTFIKNIEGSREIWTTNEMKSTKYDYMISDDWVLGVNKVIDSLTSKEAKVEFESKVSKILLDIADKAKDFKNNIEELSKLEQSFARELGIDLSLPTIKAKLEAVTEWSNFDIHQVLGNVYGKSILQGKKNNDFGRLNTLAKMEALVRFDIVENSGLDIKGNLIYAIRNPNFISNWFSDAKSDTEEGREVFKQKMFNMAKVPEAQFSNWLWNDATHKGIINYKLEGRSKIPVDINWDFMKNFNFHNLGGAKELVSRESQDYTDYSEKDYMLINLINFIRPDEKAINVSEKEFIFIPSLIPSDSGNMCVFEVPKIKLASNEISKQRNKRGNITSLSFNVVKDKAGNILHGSPLFDAVLRTNWQEVKAIQQAVAEVFDIVDGNFVPKKNLNINNLQQYLHYGKEISYKSDGTIDFDATLLEDGKPKGKVFKFNNMTIIKNGVVTTLNDIGIDIKNIIAGEVIPSDINKIKQFTLDFINQQINYGYNSYRDIETQLTGKHNGTFENLVSEYILNTYIHNVEQSNFFNGSIAEYKDNLDTNKRAKQMFSPGLALALQFTKIQYENGNYSDGNTFRAITMRDVNVVSKSIKYLEKAIKSRLIAENYYTEEEKDNVSGKLKADIESILSSYRKINAGDAQGYITLDRYVQILKGLGRYPDAIRDVVEKARKGENLNTKEITTLQPIKGFYYGREYDPALNRLTSNQIKYSSMPLIPQLVAGTELEKLMNWMNKTNTEEAFFESAHKIGAKNIVPIFDSEGVINEEALNKAVPNTYYNKNWQLQLDSPEHLLDADNMLATQIAKLIIANLDPNTKYNVDGKDYTSEELIEHYFNVLEDNIIESKDTLLKDLGVTKIDGKYIVEDKKIQKMLLEEVERRGLSDNYRYAIELDSRGTFKLPLFVNNMATKWESILTSLFTSRIIRQRLPGGSAVLGSRLGIDKVSVQDSKLTGINWSKEKEADHNLRSYQEDGKLVIEVLLSSWNSNMFKDGNRINIDDIPEELRTLIGYRIPTQAKHSMVVMKVVGFLPEQNRGMIIMPDDIVAQMGSDFDIDKAFIIAKTFYQSDGKYVIPNLRNAKAEFKALSNEVAELRSELYSIPKDEAVKTLSDVLAGYAGWLTSDNAKKELVAELKEKEALLREMGERDEEGNFVFKQASRAGRNNEIFNIYKAILTNPVHAKEIITPAEFKDFEDLKTAIEKITKNSDNTINPHTEAGQRAFRRRNISGRALKGISANLNAFGVVAQVSKMELENGFTFNIDINHMSIAEINELQKRYEEAIEIDDKSGMAKITFSKLGYAPDGSYLNLDGKLILEHASQGIGAAVDIVKKPTFDTFNATTYTYPLFHTMLLTGIPTRIAGMFIRQPILKALNDYYFETKSILGDTSGKEIESVKRFYQTQLYIELTDNNLIKADQKHQKVIDKRTANGIVNTYDKKYLIYVERDATKDLLGYDPDELIVLDEKMLIEQLTKQSNGYTSLSTEEKVNYLRTQLQVLEYFNNWKKSSESVQDILRVTKTDSIGAGPTLNTTASLIRQIEKLKDRTDVLIGDQPAVRALFPTHFGVNRESAYRPIQNFLDWGNKLSMDVLDKLFITQSLSFKNVAYTINNLVKENYKEDKLNLLNKFLNVAILQDFPAMEGFDKSTTLGINKEVNRNINVDIDTFKTLSTANKLYIMQEKMKDYLKVDSQHILNFLTPLIDNETLVKNKYHKVDIVFYKNEYTDDNLADSIDKMFNGDEFQQEMAASLIEYSFVADGLNFGLKSFAKTIPTNVLYELGLGEYLKGRQKDLDLVSSFEFDIIDKFFKNNWNNSSIVPLVKTKWDYLSGDKISQVKEMLNQNMIKEDISRLASVSMYNVFDIEKGYASIIRKDSEGNKLTKDYSPHWDSNQPTLIVNEKSLKNLNDNIVKAAYVAIPTKDDKILYKRYYEPYLDEQQEQKFKGVFDGLVYYYRVGKLGLDGINEYTEKSMFEKNNIELVESVQVVKIAENIKRINDKKVQPVKIESSSNIMKKIQSGMNYRPNALSKEEENLIFNLVKDQINKQAFSVFPTYLMANMGLMWSPEIPGKSNSKLLDNNIERSIISYKKKMTGSDGTSPRFTYHYYNRDQNNNLLPSIPKELLDLISSKVGFDMKDYDALLINIYPVGRTLGWHVDSTEDYRTIDNYPIVSVNLGMNGDFEFSNVPKNFLYGNPIGKHPTKKIELSAGDVLVFGGESRTIAHTANITSGNTNLPPLDISNDLALKTGLLKDYRINLTFRRAKPIDHAPSQFTLDNKSHIRGQLDIFNTSEDKQDQIKKDCGYGN